MKTQENAQSGNVVLMVLIGVALFAALAYTFMKGGQQGQGNMTAQQAKIQASEIIAYAQTIERAVDRLRRNGCSENQFSFDYDIAATTGYENSSAPSDFSCHVFNTNGGRAVHSASPVSGSSWAFITSRVFEVGTDMGYCSETSTTPCNDLIMTLGNLSLQTCHAIHNSIHGDTNIPLQDSGAAYDTAGTKFIGSYSPGTPDIEMGARPIKTTACIQGTDSKYYFYHVIFAR